MLITILIFDLDALLLQLGMLLVHHRFLNPHSTPSHSILSACPSSIHPPQRPALLAPSREQSRYPYRDHVGLYQSLLFHLVAILFAISFSTIAPIVTYGSRPPFFGGVTASHPNTPSLATEISIPWDTRGLHLRPDNFVPPSLVLGNKLIGQ